MKMTNPRTIEFTKPIIIDGKSITEYTFDNIQILCNERTERYALERVFEANGFKKVRTDGKDAKKEDQDIDEAFKDFLYAEGLPELGFYPKLTEVQNDNEVLYAYNQKKVSDFVISCTKWGGNLENYKKAVERAIAKREGRELPEEEKPEKKAKKKSPINNIVETVKTVFKPPIEDKVNKNSAPWTRPMTDVDESGRPAPADDAPQVQHEVQINVVPNSPTPLRVVPINVVPDETAQAQAAPQQTTKKTETMVMIPTFDDKQDLTKFMENPGLKTVIEAYKGRMSINVMETIYGVYNILAFNKAGNYKPERSIVVDVNGKVYEGSWKFWPITGEKNLEDRPMATFKADNIQSLIKYISRGKMPEVPDGEKQLRKDFYEANKLVNIATMGGTASQTSKLVKLILTRKVELENISKQFGGARLRVLSFEGDNLDKVTLITDQSPLCTNQLYGTITGPVSPMQALIVADEPIAVSPYVVVA